MALLLRIWRWNLDAQTVRPDRSQWFCSVSRRFLLQGELRPSPSLNQRYAVWLIFFFGSVSLIKCWRRLVPPARLPPCALKRAVQKFNIPFCHPPLLTLNKATLVTHSSWGSLLAVSLFHGSSGQNSWKLSLPDTFLSHLSMHVIGIRLLWPWRRYVSPKRRDACYHTLQVPRKEDQRPAWIPANLYR